MNQAPNSTTLPVDAAPVQPSSERHLGLRIVMGGQGILRRISGPAMTPSMPLTPVPTEPETTPAATDVEPTQLPSPSDNTSKAELEDAIDKLVGQEILSFHITNIMNTNDIGGTLLAQHTYLNKLIIIHAIDVAIARACAKFTPQRPRAAKRVQHPSLINVLHHATHHRFILVFTDMVEGDSVANLLAQQAPMSESRALEIVKSVCEGLAASYDNQLTHGGICPEHIFVGPDGQPKLVDYCWHLYVREGSLDPFQCHQSIYGNLPRWTTCARDVYRRRGR